MTEKVDWRNYDYSEGPPRKSNALSTTSSSHFSSNHSVVSTHSQRSYATNVTNGTSASAARRNVMPHLAVKHSFATSQEVTDHRRLSSHPVSSLDGARASHTQPEPEARLAYRPPPSLLEDNGNQTASTLHPQHHQHQLQHQLQDKIEKKTHLLTKRSIIESGAMNERRIKAVTLNQSIEEDEPFDIQGGGGGQRRGGKALITPPRSDDYNTNSNEVNKQENPGFNQAWEQAEEEWQQAENQSHIQNFVSDDEDHMDILGPEEPLPRGEESSHYEFESFAGDRSTGTGMTGYESKSVKSGAAGGGDNHLALGVGMEVNVNTKNLYTKPKSILRNGASPTGATSGSDMSVTSKRRKHPWDASEANSPREQTIVEEQEKNTQGPTTTTRQKQQQPEDDDDDTLFKFKEDGSKVASADSKMSSSTGGSGSRSKLSQKERRKLSRLRKEEELNKGENSDSCDSIDGLSPSPKKRGDTLQDRTKQAWSARNKSVSMLREEGIKGNPNNAVSFHGNSTVHEYQPEEENSASGSSDDSGSQYTEYSEFDDETIYTRGEATIMEDMFLDFFMIGGDESRSKRKARRNVEYVEDDNTIGDVSTLDGSLTHTNRNLRKGDGKGDLRTVPEDSSDPFTQIFNTVEQGITNCFSSMGLLTDPNGRPKQQPKESEKKRTDDNSVTNSINTVETSLSQWAHYASDLIFATGELQNSRSQDEDGDLVLLAMSAARVKHLKNQMQYDEDSEMDVRNEIKFAVITVGLPIGILFGENEFCCWVDDIFPTGNVATKFKGDKLEIGDHLASINGLNAIHLSITEVCKILANVANPNEIELTFLRYVGPYRPLSGEDQQGYEVIDPQISNEAGNRAGVVNLYKKASAPSRKIVDSPERSTAAVKSTAVPSPMKEKKSPRRPTRNSKPLSPKMKKGEGSAGNRFKKEQSVPASSTKKKKKFGFFRRKKKGEKKSP